MRPTALTAYRWELRKLVSQKRTYIGLGAAAALPILFTVVLSTQGGGPHEAPLAQNLHKTGIALTLVVLTFVSRFAAQLLTALVAGDIVAAESSAGTLKMILTRSLKRSQILTGKILASFTYAVALLAALLAAGLVSGIVAWGFKPLTTLSFTKISAPHALGIFAVPLLAIAAFGVFLSALARNSAAAIVGTLVFELAQEAIGGLVHVTWIKHYLLSSQFDAWLGFFHTPTDWSLVIRAAWVSAVYAALPLAGAYLVFMRRDVAGD